MKILEGLFDHMVLQRTRRNVSEAEFSGTCAGSGSVKATVSRKARAVPGFAAVTVGCARNGRIAGCLRGLPAGGPYDVELCIRDTGGATLETLRVKDVLVGDVWLLGGQSNMQGCGLLADNPPTDPLVRAFYMDDTWAPARDPIHTLWDAVDQVHTDLNGGIRHVANTVSGAGPGVAFAQRMRELTGVPQGIIACAHGGTSMSQWDPKLKKLGRRSLYGATLRRFRKNGSSVAGLVWYQGCSDANAEAGPLYTRRMQALIRALRRDCGIASLPAAVVQIARVVGWPADQAVHWNSIQEQQRLLPQTIPHCTVVPAIDLAIDDPIHIGGRDQIRLGHRLADAMQALRAGRKAGLPPIALREVSIDGSNVIAEFDHVAGGLRSGSRPAGFAVTGPASDTNVFDVRLDGSRAIVRTCQSREMLATHALQYGRGVDPYCNITDDAGRSLPVFGPVPLGKPRALTDFVKTLRVSAFQPGAGKLHDLACPEDTERLQLSPRSFGGFCDCHAEISARAPEDLVLYYACRLECPEDMKVGALLGYDGPLKVWVNGTQVFHDPEGTNPALPTDRAEVPMTLHRGPNEVLIALGTNNGRAWGIYLCFERLDVPRRLLVKGRAHYAMPEVRG